MQLQYFPPAIIIISYIFFSYAAIEISLYVRIKILYVYINNIYIYTD